MKDDVFILKYPYKASLLIVLVLATRRIKRRYINYGKEKGLGTNSYDLKSGELAVVKSYEVFGSFT